MGHLKKFKVENFKKFDSLEVNNIGQFNLIIGDNNVGKTCLLEAINEKEELYISKKYDIANSLGIASASLYNRLCNEDGVVQIENYLNIVFYELLGITTRYSFENGSLQISTHTKSIYHSISEYGRGFTNILNTILLTLSSKNSIVTIDEIGTSIHYSKIKLLWEVIFKICKQLNIQLFATTHYKECIEAFVEASKEISEKSIRLIRLQENKDKSIKAICYPFEELEYIVESNTEER